MTRWDYYACAFALALALATLGCSDGMEVPPSYETPPETPVEAPNATLDAGLGPDTSPMDTTATVDATGGDAWWTAYLGQGQCGEGYEQKLYAPNDMAWCEEIPGVDAGGHPCGDANPVGWYKAGLYMCVKVLP